MDRFRAMQTFVRIVDGGSLPAALAHGRLAAAKLREFLALIR